MSRIALAMIAMSGRVTMLGISCWTEAGGSYRTVQRFFATVIPWASLFWLFFRTHLYRQEEVYLLAGDEVVVTKAGKATPGLDRFFASLYGKPVPGLAFFALALVSVQARHAFAIAIEQVIRSEAEKAASKAKAVAKQAKPAGAKRPLDDPKGARTKAKQTSN
jgi:IS4 transposase